MGAPRNRRQAWTIVQHSAFGYGGNPEFEHAIEVRELGQEEPFKRELGRVLLAGGIVFDDYMNAIAFEHSEGYPPGTEGIIPAAPGRFAEEKIDGLAVYVPDTALHQEWIEIGKRICEWAGAHDREQAGRLARALPHSSIPDACGTVGDALWREAADG
jgi:hypothetical protein